MKKLFVILCLALLASSLVAGCKPPGLPCANDKDCCEPLVCNPWAGRCTKKPGPPLTTSPPADPAQPPADNQL